MPVVSDFTALLSGSSWSAGVPGRAAFVTFSFDTAVAPHIAASYPQPFLATFQAFTEADQALTRTILEAYAAVSGLTLFEVPAGQGDVRFGKYDLDLAPGSLSAAVGFAHYPGVSVTPNGVSEFPSGGDVFIHARSLNPVLLAHEIAHALGLKHPFEGPISLDPALLTPANSALVGGVAGRLGPGLLDIEALQYLYGGPGADGSQVASWSWDAAAFRLTQTGSAGADTILGVGSGDAISGGDGADVLAGKDGADSLSGGAGADGLYGGTGGDTLDGGDGADTVQGGGGDDLIRGGAGNDILSAAGRSTVDGGDGVDTLTFGGFSTVGQVIDIAAVTIVGVENLTIAGGAEGDTITGSAGADTIGGNGGPDLIRSGGGDDLIVVSSYAATVDGGDGFDRLTIYQFSAGPQLIGSADAAGITGVEAITYAGGQFADTIVGSAAGEGLSGLGGDDVLVPGGGADTMFGGDGVDTVDFSGEAARIDLTVSSSRLLSPGVFEFMGQVENVIGTGFDDAIRGDAADNQIYGRLGNDSLSGGAGANYLRGDEGNDTVQGGAGFDDINGNMGADSAAGGEGGDWVVGGKDDDRLFGDAGDDLVYGNLGADTLEGGLGADIVRGGQGDDVITGGEGADFMAGDRGADTVTGGNGADSFHTAVGAGLDRVVDFSIAQGDRILLPTGTAYVLRQAGADTVVDLGGEDQMVLVGVSMSSLTAGTIGFV